MRTFDIGRKYFILKEAITKVINANIYGTIGCACTPYTNTLYHTTSLSMKRINFHSSWEVPLIDLFKGQQYHASLACRGLLMVLELGPPKRYAMAQTNQLTQAMNAPTSPTHPS